MATAEDFACTCPTSGYSRRATGAFTLRRSLYTPKCTLGTHSHADSRIVVTLKGAFETRYGRLGFGLNTTRALFRTAVDDHADTYPEVTHCLTVALSPGETVSLAGTKPFAVDDDEILTLGRHISVEMDRYDTASTFVLDGLCAELAARIARREPRESPAAGWIRSVRSWLEDEYCAPPSLRTIADAVDRDVSYVAATFKKQFGKTIGNYVRDLRIRHALKLVGDHQIPLAEVAQRSGFADQSHFARLFRRRFSVSPGEFRRRGYTGQPRTI